MGAPGGTLALDLGIHAAWAYGHAGDCPDFGAWELPAKDDLRGIPLDQRASILTGARGAALENELEDLMGLLRPRRMFFAVRFAANQTSAYLLTGLAVAAEISAYRAGVETVEKVAEQTARLDVLGRGTFGERDPDNRGRIIKGTGSKGAKDAAMAWCAAQGWQVPSHDVADALVIWQHAVGSKHARVPA